jgi:curved DNA-binding protein CbpA
MTRDWAEVDYYAVLGVPTDAPTELIADTFRTLAKQLHPDVAGEGSDDAERFKVITAAYEVLSDPRRRADYDRVRPRRPDDEPIEPRPSEPFGRVPRPPAAPTTRWTRPGCASPWSAGSSRSSRA